MQRNPARDILEEEEDGKYTKSGVSPSQRDVVNLNRYLS